MIHEQETIFEWISFDNEFLKTISEFNFNKTNMFECFVCRYLSFLVLLGSNVPVSN